MLNKKGLKFFLTARLDSVAYSALIPDKAYHMMTNCNKKWRQNLPVVSGWLSSGIKEVTPSPPVSKFSSITKVKVVIYKSFNLQP